MRRFLISFAVGLGLVFGAIAPIPASAYGYYHPYYHHHYYHPRYYHHRYLPVSVLATPFLCEFTNGRQRTSPLQVEVLHSEMTVRIVQ